MPPSDCLCNDTQTHLLKRCLEVSSFIRDNKGRITRSEKENFGTSENYSLHAIVTSMDVFAQDYLACSLTRLTAPIRLFGEEEGLAENAKEIGTGKILLVDPIDGTKWYATGSDDYSCLLTLLDQGIPTFAVGIFPERIEGYVADGNSIKALRLFDRAELSLEPLSLALTKETRVACHYRLTNEEFRNKFNAVAEKFGEPDYNGHGFGTNLTLVRKALNGNYSAFIAPKMSIVDGFPIAFLLKSAGWHLKFFDVKDQTSAWQNAKDWSYADFGPAGKLRTRYIAAKDEVLLADITKLMTKSS